MHVSEDEIKSLVVDDKWLGTLAAAVQGELDRVSQTLTGRIRQLAERYATPLPQLTDEVAALAAKVDGHLKIRIAHGEEYGEYLELSRKGRRPILEPTAQKFAPEFFEAAQKVLTSK